MKVIAIIIGTAFLIVAGVMISLIRSGGALKPAGVIKPAEIGPDPTFIGKQIAIRLFPDFQEAKHVIWRVEDGADDLATIARDTFSHYRSPTPHTLIDLRSGAADTCLENCWYIADWKTVLQKPGPIAEVFVQHFDRNEQVSPTCESEKILEPDCLRPISVREVRRKLKTSAPYFFMQRYLKSQFYLFVERKN